jgi:hypothetical protein
MGKLGLLIATFFHIIFNAFCKNISKRVYCFIWKMEIGSIAHQETHLDVFKLGHSALATTTICLRMSGQEAKGILRYKGLIRVWL